MTITQYIREKYPIHNRIKEIMANPYSAIANEDGLPYDVIGPDDEGHVTKLVFVNTDGRTISVIDLITLSPEEREADLELATIYETYMSQVDYEEVNLSDITKMAQSYKDFRKRSEEAAGVLSL